jgi:hypothetical protein
MLGLGVERSKLSAVRQRLERWRERHGGRGRRIPEELWNAATEVARVDGVGSTARALRLDVGLLARRLEVASRPADLVPVQAMASEAPRASDDFIELDARALSAPGQMVVRLESEDGEKLELELSGACMPSAVQLARAFWSRPR